MMIEPVKIEEGFIKRFFKNSVLLIMKNITAWVMYMTIMFVLSIGLDSFLGLMSVTASKTTMLFVPMILKVVFGVWMLFLGLELSANIDYNTPNQFKIFSMLKLTFKHTMNFLRNNIAYLFTLMIFLTVLGFLFFNNAKDTYAVYDEDMFGFITSTFVLMNHMIFWGFLTASNSQGLFSYPIVRQFGLDSYVDARDFSKKGFQINPSLSIFKNGLFPMIILISPIFTFLFLMPIFMPFVSLYTYVAFREVFLNKKENEKEEVKVSENKKELALN